MLIADSQLSTPLNDLPSTSRRPLKNPGFDAEWLGSLLRFRRAVSGNGLESRDHHDVHNLVIIGLVVAVNNYRASAGRQCDKILMLNQQTTAIGHMNGKWSKGPGVKQLSDLIRFHLANNSPVENPSKGGKRS